MCSTLQLVGSETEEDFRTARDSNVRMLMDAFKEV